MKRTDQQENIFLKRLFILLFIMVLAGIAVIARAFQLQYIEADKYATEAEKNSVEIQAVSPKRGRIFDRNGFLIADNQLCYGLYVVPSKSKSIRDTVDKIRQIIDVNDREYTLFFEKYKTHSRYLPLMLKQSLSWKEVASIEARNHLLPGVHVGKWYRRIYPSGHLVGHITGFVNMPNKQEVIKNAQLKFFDYLGKSGLEKERDEYLRGSLGHKKIETNAHGKPVRLIENHIPENGENLKLSIDITLQNHIHNLFKSHVGSAVVMDINTGEVLSLLSVPSFDANDFVGGIDTTTWNQYRTNMYKPLLDRSIKGMYSPGSVFKMIVALAALEEAETHKNEVIFCPGHMKIGNRHFHCWKRGGHGHVNMEKSIRESCDVYYYELAMRIGIEKIRHYANILGIGLHTNISLPGEKSGLMPHKEWKRERYGEPWYKGETANAAIGQGYVLCTPLQLCVMTARLASGRVVTPTIYKIEDDHVFDKMAFLPFKKNHLHHITHSMQQVIHHKKGTAHKHRLAGSDYTIPYAGKTGTVQVKTISYAERMDGVRKNEELPWHLRDHSIFIAFAPYNKPKYAIAVVAEHAGSGSGIAAEITKNIIHYLLKKHDDETLDIFFNGPDAPPLTNNPSTETEASNGH